MGFAYESPAAMDFYDSDTGYEDTEGFREDLRAKLITEHKGEANGVSTSDLAKYYYGENNLEACLTMENELQLARYILLSRGIILRNSHYRWHIVDSAIEALSFLTNRTLRIVKADLRTRVASAIALEQYPELAEYSTPKALVAMSKQFDKLKAAALEDVKRLSEKV